MRQWSPLESAVLALLARQAAYGYEIGHLLNSAGFGDVKGGTLYPLLRRLEDAGYIEGKWRIGDDGPRRRYYEVTAPGYEEIARRRTAWEMLRQAMDGAFGAVR